MIKIKSTSLNERVAVVDGAGDGHTDDSPAFERARVHLERGKHFRAEAPEPVEGKDDATDIIVEDDASGRSAAVRIEHVVLRSMPATQKVAFIVAAINEALAKLA